MPRVQFPSGPFLIFFNWDDILIGGLTTLKKDILKHSSVPEHEILADNEVEKLLKKLEIKKHQFPKIKVTDPVSKAIGAEVGNVLKITRQSETAGVFVTYRLVQK